MLMDLFGYYRRNSFKMTKKELHETVEVLEQTIELLNKKLMKGGR